MSAKKLENIKAGIAFIEDYLPEIDQSDFEGVIEFLQMTAKLHRLQAMIA